MKRNFKMKKKHFSSFCERVFIEANKTIFLEYESPTLIEISILRWKQQGRIPEAAARGAL